MAIETPQFRIIPDPKDSRFWAYELLLHDAICDPVGGFKSPRDARRALERVRRRTAAQQDNARTKAEQRVFAVRGSWDAPGFEACVEAEMRTMEKDKP